MSVAFTTQLSGTQCLVDSLGVLNNNFNNLDTTVCSLSNAYTNFVVTTAQGPAGDNSYGIPGLITAFAGATQPTNWLLISPPTAPGTLPAPSQDPHYTDLYSALSGDSNYNTGNTQTFGLPNVQTTVVYGTNSNLGGAGAISTTTLAPTAQLTISSNTPDYFGGTTSWPAGYYRVQYVTGGYNLGSTSNWTNIIGYGCNLVYSNNSIPTSGVYIGIYDKNISQTYTQLISGGQNYLGYNQPYHYDFYHTGGPIYVYLWDDKYTDNTIGNAGSTNTGTPTWSLYSRIPTLALNYIISTIN